MSEVALVEERAVSTRNEEQLVTMTVDGQLFGLPILSVQDIVETHKITQVPRTPSAISGIMNLRGRIVTVINLRRILGRSDDSNSRMGVTVEFKGDLYTILVDQIGEVRLLNRTDFESAPATLDPKLKQLCTGIYRLDGELLAVLDVNQILSPETIAQTPPIQFFARRQKDAAAAPAAVAKALPPPVMEEPAGETEDAVLARHGKNLFRKIKASTAASAAHAAPPSEEPAAGRSASAKSASGPSSKGTSAKSSNPAKKIAIGGVNGNAAVTPAAAPPSCPPNVASPSKDLLDLLGGDATLAVVVSAFYAKVAADKRLAARFGNLDTARQSKAMLSFLTGALKANGSKPIAGSGHQWLSPTKGLNDDDFNRCLSHFEAALHTKLVPEGTIFRVLAVFERYRESVVD